MRDMHYSEQVIPRYFIDTFLELYFRLYCFALKIHICQLSHDEHSCAVDLLFLSLFLHFLLTFSSQCSTTGVTKAVICAILSVECCI